MEWMNVASNIHRCIVVQPRLKILNISALYWSAQSGLASRCRAMAEEEEDVMADGLWTCYTSFLSPFSQCWRITFKNRVVGSRSASGTYFVNQNLIISSLSHTEPVHKVSSGSVHKFLRYPVHRQRDRNGENITSFTLGGGGNNKMSNPRDFDERVMLWFFRDTFLLARQSHSRPHPQRYTWSSSAERNR